MIELLIIADDYTGSLDTGVQFAQCGFATYVTSHEQLDLQALPDGTQVLVVDAQSRHIARGRRMSGSGALRGRRRSWAPRICT